MTDFPALLALLLVLSPPADALVPGVEAPGVEAPAPEASTSPSPAPMLVRALPRAADPAPRSLQEAAPGVRLNRGALDGWIPLAVPIPSDPSPVEALSRETVPTPPIPSLRVDVTSFSGPDRAGDVSVWGRVRNEGTSSACGVVVTLVAYDEKTQQPLGQSEVRPSLRTIDSGRTASFRGPVRIPSGTGPPESFFRGRSYTAPDWKHRLGRVEASVASGSACR